MSEIWETEGFFIGEDDYADRMKAEVDPFIENEVRRGTFTTKDGLSLSYYFYMNDSEKSRGTIVMTHGFCEFFGKFHETFYYFCKSGFSVFFLEDRGHGHSDRVHKDFDPDMVWVASFDDYVNDFIGFTEKVVAPMAPPAPLMAYSHSMGGCVLAITLERRPDLFDRAVLSSPMMALSWGGHPMAVIHLLLLKARITGKMDTYMPGQHGFDDVVTFPHCSMKSRARYDRMFKGREDDPGNRCYGGSYAWGAAALSGMKECLKNAEKIETPILLCTAGEDNMVEPSGQDTFMERCRTAKRLLFNTSRHEIYNALDEERISYFKALLRYYSEAAV